MSRVWLNNKSNQPTSSPGHSGGALIKPQQDRHTSNQTCNCNARVQTHSDPERDEGCERNSREEVAGELVVACGDAAEVLQPAESCLMRFDGMMGEPTELRALIYAADSREIWVSTRRIRQRYVSAVLGPKTSQRSRLQAEAC